MKKMVPALGKAQLYNSETLDEIWGEGEGENIK